MAIFSLSRLLEVELHFSYSKLFYKVLFSQMKSLIHSNSSEFQKRLHCQKTKTNITCRNGFEQLFLEETVT